MKCYSTQRPIVPGTFPKPAGNKVVNIVNFDTRQFCKEIGRNAWGYIEYESPLATDTAKQYELVIANELKN